MHRLKSLLVLASLAILGTHTVGCTPNIESQCLVPGRCQQLPDAGDQIPNPGEHDAGLPELPAIDAGLPEIPVIDAGLPELPVIDAGLPEIPVIDAGPPDAGTKLHGNFLDDSEYADLIAIHADFPFGVTKRYVADKTIISSHWGHHGGPMVTVGNFGGKRSKTRAVLQWSIGSAPTGTATFTPRTLTVASDLPKPHFYGSDGMVDLPFGGLALLSYTSTGSTFPGEALLYSQTYDAVVGRAKANGFYSGVGVVVGETRLLVYSGLSALTKTTSEAVENGLYAAPICNDALLADPPCPANWQLFGWKGNSGPVVTDAHGNVFVAASLSRAEKSDTVYGLANMQLAIGTTPKPTTIVEVNTLGTSSFAAIPPKGNAPGWVMGHGYSSPVVIYAASYTESDNTLETGGQVIPAAISVVGDNNASVFTDNEGALWLAVTKGSSGAFLKLERRTP